MKHIKAGEYLPPMTEFFGLRYEGVLCESTEVNYEGSTNEGYSSSDELFGIF
jgi:hypothetical protein